MSKRKNKGYQRQYDRRGREVCYPEGDNKSLEQVELSCDNNTLQRINIAKRSYKEIAKHPELSGKALKDYCREWMLWEVKFDDNFNVIPLETVIEQIKNDGRHYKSSRIYGARRFTGYMRRITNKDNQKFVFNGTGNWQDDPKYAENFSISEDGTTVNWNGLDRENDYIYGSFDSTILTYSEELEKWVENEVDRIIKIKNAEKKKRQLAEQQETEKRERALLAKLQAKYCKPKDNTEDSDNETQEQE